MSLHGGDDGASKSKLKAEKWWPVTVNGDEEKLGSRVADG